MCAYYHEPMVCYNEHSKYIIIKPESHLGLHAVILFLPQTNSADRFVGASLTGASVTGICMFLNMASIYVWGAAALLQKPAALL